MVQQAMLTKILNKDITEHITNWLNSTGRFNKPVLLDQWKWNCSSVSYVFLRSLFCKFITDFVLLNFEFQYYYLYLDISTDHSISN